MIYSNFQSLYLNCRQEDILAQDPKRLNQRDHPSSLLVIHKGLDEFVFQITSRTSLIGYAKATLGYLIKRVALVESQSRNVENRSRLIAFYSIEF